VNYLPVYLDSSAIVKLVVPEIETDALLTELERWPDRVAAALAIVEVHRALRRKHQPSAAHARADAVLATLGLIRLDTALLSRAAQFASPEMRSLDAIQLAAALSIGDEPGAFVTYDARLARAAREEGLTVLHPGVKALTGRL
jgi:predicted nucleic acid-binding protein